MSLGLICERSVNVNYDYAKTCLLVGLVGGRRIMVGGRALSWIRVDLANKKYMLVVQPHATSNHAPRILAATGCWREHSKGFVAAQRSRFGSVLGWSRPRRHCA